MPRASKVSLLSHASKDPETLLRFKKALDKAKSDRKEAIAAQRSLERSKYGLDGPDGEEATKRFIYNTTRSKAGSLLQKDWFGPGKFKGDVQRAVARIDSVSTVHDAKVKKLQKLYDAVLNNEKTPMSNPPTNAQYIGGVGRSNPQEMFLGGFFKGAGKFAKFALPLVSLVPGVGTGIGLAATLAGELLNSGDKKGKDNADDLTGNVKDQKKSLDQVTADKTVQLAELSKRSAQGTFGADFKTGGVLSNNTENLKDITMGNNARRIGKTAIEFTGPDHAGGGISLPGMNAEVEGGETLDLLIGKGGNVKSRGVPFVFSKALKVPGTNLSFANAHKATVKRGGSDDDIRRLAFKQERISGALRGNTPQDKMFLGGLIKRAGGIGNIIGNVAPFIPGIVNTIRGATSKVESAKMAPIDRGSLGILAAERSRIARNQDEYKINPNSALRENRRLLGSVFADRNTSDAAKAAAIAGTQTRAEGIRTDYDNREREINIGLRADKRRDILGLTQQMSQQEAGYSQFDTQADFQNQQERLQAKGARSDILNTGLAQIGNVFTGLQQNKINKRFDDRMLDMLSRGRDPAVTKTLGR